MLTLMLGSTLAFSPMQPAPAQSHEDSNPIYKGLLGSGLEVGPNIKAKFPAPSMPDGLAADKQMAIIKELIGNDYGYADFTRNSVVAPQLIKIHDVQPSDKDAPARGVDVWFLAYGDFNAINDEKFLDKILKAGRGNGNTATLKKEDLEKRKITIGDEKHEGYVFIDFDFLEKVKLKATGRGFWSKTADSALISGEIDPRFRGDPQFPNQWQSIDKQSGALKLGPASPWSGAGFYLKITKLKEPANALFIEQHVIFAEPIGWFNGEALLRSKLPIAVQNNVRNIRREWINSLDKEK
jgi:hypothetical protein